MMVKGSMKTGRGVPRNDGTGGKLELGMRSGLGIRSGLRRMETLWYA